MQENIIIGIDLAGTEKNPTGWALWKNKVISTCHLYENQEILEHLTKFEHTLIAIDAPLSLPKRGTIKKRIKKCTDGDTQFSPTLSSHGKVNLTRHRDNSAN